MTGLLFEDAQKVARQGAGLIFTGVVRRLYRTLTGEAPKGDAVRLLERLFAEDRLTPDAALYLLSIARALGDAARTQSGAFELPRAWRERVETLGTEFAQRLIRAAVDRP